MAAPCGDLIVVSHFLISIILIVLDDSCSFTSVNAHQANAGEGFFLCRKCGLEVGQSKDLLSLPTRLALRQRNDTIVDKHQLFIQLFQNPHGKYFKVITTNTASVQRANDKHAADTWFPGYAWSLIFCPRCGHHLGWWFDAITESVDSLQLKVTSFVGFILDHIMHEDEENNLIAVPKSYMS